MLALIVVVVAELILLGVWAVHDVGDAFPFATTYVLPHYDAAILAAMTALWGSYVISRRLRGRTLHVATACVVAVLIASVFAYSLYHGVHPAPPREDATAFHEQLALPVLVALAGIAALFVITATSCTRRDRSCPAR